MRATIFKIVIVVLSIALSITNIEAQINMPKTKDTAVIAKKEWPYLIELKTSFSALYLLETMFEFKLREKLGVSIEVPVSEFITIEPGLYLYQFEDNYESHNELVKNRVLDLDFKKYFWDADPKLECFLGAYIRHYNQIRRFGTSSYSPLFNVAKKNKTSFGGLLGAKYNLQGSPLVFGITLGGGITLKSLNTEEIDYLDDELDREKAYSGEVPISLRAAISLGIRINN